MICETTAGLFLPIFISRPDSWLHRYDESLNKNSWKHNPNNPKENLPSWLGYLRNEIKFL